MKKIVLTALGLTVFLSLSGTAQYKDFVRKETRTKLFEVAFDNKTLSVSVFAGEDVKKAVVNRPDVTITDTEVKLNSDVSFTSAGLNFNGSSIPFSDITDALILNENDLITITFYKSGQPSSRVTQMHSGNIVTFSDPVLVKPGDFVRGMIFSVKGPITVHGEVNKDIISLFGDVTLVPGAVARGHLVSITGTVKVEQQASLYGEIYSGTKDYDARRFRFYRINEFELGIMLNYNRVDGLLMGGKLSYVDSDSTLPTAEIGLGYALESERLRYFARATQTIKNKYALKFGAEYYKKLDSEDDWLLSNAENAVFVFLATEDYKDYFETEGFEAWFSLEPVNHLKLKTGFRYDDTRQLRDRRHLWSLFGGSKIFRENFSSVEEPFRSVGISEINSFETGSIFLNADYDTRDLDADSNFSGWALSGELEWSNPDLASDFEYRRYSLAAVRWQRLNEYANLKLRGKLANSDGYLPMYKRYFVGGLGTLQGYGHKEFIGTRYWMANSEFWLRLPTSIESNLVLVWDVVQIANDKKLDENAEIRHDLGFGISLSSLRLDVTKRLDSAPDRDPQIHVRFARRF